MQLSSSMQKLTCAETNGCFAVFKDQIKINFMSTWRTKKWVWLYIHPLLKTALPWVIWAFEMKTLLSKISSKKPPTLKNPNFYLPLILILLAGFKAFSFVVILRRIRFIFIRWYSLLWKSLFSRHFRSNALKEELLSETLVFNVDICKQQRF